VTMTSDDEMLTWARNEHAQRMSDLAAVNALPVEERAAALTKVQRAAAARRRAAGLSVGQAFALIRRAIGRGQP
jgi:hypothetical protein